MKRMGLLAWQPSHGLGGHPKVATPYKEALQQAVETAPRALGQATSSWTCGALAAYLVAQGHVGVSDEPVRRHLHALDYAVIRPVLSVRSPDSQYAEKVAVLRAYEAQAACGEVTLLFEDEVDLHVLPGIAGSWTKRGTQRKVPTPGTNQKRYGFGAVNVVTGAITRLVCERKNSDSFCALLEALVAAYCPGESWGGPKLVLVVDNFIIHRSKATKRLLERYADRLVLCELPTYAPQLNVIEVLWKHLRRKVTHNHLFASMTALVAAVEQFFTDLDRQPVTVLSIIGRAE